MAPHVLLPTAELIALDGREPLNTMINELYDRGTCVPSASERKAFVATHRRNDGGKRDEVTGCYFAVDPCRQSSWTGRQDRVEQKARDLRSPANCNFADITNWNVYVLIKAARPAVDDSSTAPSLLLRCTRLKTAAAPSVGLAKARCGSCSGGPHADLRWRSSTSQSSGCSRPSQLAWS